jgi:hypothetical protein
MHRKPGGNDIPSFLAGRIAVEQHRQKRRDAERRAPAM